MCQWRELDGTYCGERATDVDHIRPGNDHSDNNLRSLCAPHHKRKSSTEGAEALAKKRRQIAKRYQRVEGHPGLL